MADLGAIGKRRTSVEGNKVGGYTTMNAGGAGSHTDAFGKSQSLATGSTTSVVGASISIH